ITRLLISFPFSKSTVISLREIFVESQVYPTAILATGIHLYAQTYPLLAGLGIRIPEQVAVVGRGHPSGRIFQKIPPVNLVENDMDAIGSTSATIIRRLIDGHEIPSMTLLEMPYLDRG